MLGASGAGLVTPEVPPACEVDAPVTAKPFAVAMVEALAGDFEIVMVDTTFQPPRVLSRRLHLYVNDSVRRYPPAGAVHGQGARHLGGWIVTEQTDGYGTRGASRDPDHPGVIWIADRLRIGDYDWLDGSGEDLRVTWLSASGFGGAWTSDQGFEITVDSTGRVLPDPAGRFCAWRR